MNQQHVTVIENFYRAFAQQDAEAMVQCYTTDVQFSDPVFPDLKGDEAMKMWRMLTTRAKHFSLTFDQVWADDQKGGARWVANYLFSATGRNVENIITAEFKFRDGKICWHRDQFDFWRWTRQALGLPGVLLGWTPLIQNKVRAQAAAGLRDFVISGANANHSGEKA